MKSFAELQPIFTELRLFKDFTPALEGLPQPSQCLSKSAKITTNTKTAMLSIFDKQIVLKAFNCDGSFALKKRPSPGSIRKAFDLQSLQCLPFIRQQNNG